MKQAKKKKKKKRYIYSARKLSVYKCNKKAIELACAAAVLLDRHFIEF
jgi:hypothetical protein